MVIGLLFLLSTFVTYFLCFKLLLKKLGVESLILKRTLILSITLVSIQFVCILFAEQAELDNSASVIMTIILFALILKRFIVLESWKAILVPIIIPILGQVTFAISLLIYIGITGTVKV